jgi:hypothetical protein
MGSRSCKDQHHSWEAGAAKISIIHGKPELQRSASFMGSRSCKDQHNSWEAGAAKISIIHREPELQHDTAPVPTVKTPSCISYAFLTYTK